MPIDKKYIDQIIKVSEKAALAASYLVGKKDKIAADQAAVDSMRSELNKINMNGEVVIGEGALDEAPMLYTGEKLGNKNGPYFDIAVDPLEGTNFVANNLPGATSVIAIAEKGNLFNAPETYMDKIATGPIEKGLIDLDFPLKKNISNLSEFLNKNISSLTACVMDRPRHKKIINELKKLKVKIKLITDGDVLGALYVTNQKYNVDIFLGIGGGPEGVLAASALDAFDCHFQGRFIFDNDKDIKDAKKMGINDLNKKYELNEIIKGDTIFCSTGITSSEMLNGVVINNNEYITETLVTHKSLKFKSKNEAMSFEYKLKKDKCMRKKILENFNK
ncbi:class II fructose-bisphosphatase [Candidatus Pelagibacter sp.]|nr:class II fructose-bisphosphatase [Candidatus Pelagibacter sp.]